MRKIVLAAAAVLSFVLVSCGTTEVAGSGIKGKADKISKNHNEIIDYQGSSFGSEIPQWVKLIGDGQYGDKALGKVMPDVEGKKVFVTVARGDNLEFVKQWTDLVDIEVQVGDTLQRVVAKSVEAEFKAKAKEKGSSADPAEVEKNLNMYKAALSSVEINGLEKVASYWIKKIVYTPDVESKKNKETKEIVFEYYSVWTMDKSIFNRQLDVALETVDDNTDEGSALKAALRERLFDTSVVEAKF